MSKVTNYFKNNRLIIIILIIVGIIFAGLWNVVSGGYDKQNNVILFIKKFIPSKVSRKAHSHE